LHPGGALTSVGAVTSRGVTVCIALAIGATACSDDGYNSSPTTTTIADDSTTSTASSVPERPSSTTTTAFDPESVEGAVEAAYLKSWDVYAEAVYNLELDEPALAEVYAGASLEGKTTEISERISDGRAALVEVEHEYDIVLVDEATARVVDRFVNHQVLIDPDTKQPIEDDPDERLVFNFEMKAIEGAWRVTFIERVNL
jgi:hypothetical protein